MIQVVLLSCVVAACLLYYLSTDTVLPGDPRPPGIPNRGGGGGGGGGSRGGVVGDWVQYMPTNKIDMGGFGEDMRGVVAGVNSSAADR